MIRQKPKICIGCNTPQLLWSHGYCKRCWSNLHPVIFKRKNLVYNPKKVYQNNAILSEKEAFMRSYHYWEGKWHISQEKVALEVLKAGNFAHILPKAKNKFPWFKYYWKNIVLLTLDEHRIFDFANDGQKYVYITKLSAMDKIRWSQLYELEAELKLEYQEWIKEHPGEYKI